MRNELKFTPQNIATPLLAAALAAVLATAYMTINVLLNYGGNITGLFYTGVQVSLPAELAAEPTWRIKKDQKGYDGQYYHLIAHDPLIQRGFDQYVDNPRLRWRRIGVPGLAALAVAGSDRFVDGSYLTLQVVFVFFGTLWLSRYAQLTGWHPFAGIVFLFIPAVLVSLDRMTVDLGLAALTVGLFWYTTQRTASPAVFGILLLAPMVRETGMLLVAGWCLWNGLQRRWVLMISGAACALPALGWWAYVASRTPPDATEWLVRYPFSGLIDRTVTGHGVPAGTLWLRAAGVTENLALTGIWLALILVIHLISRRRLELLEVSAAVFLAFAALLGKYDIWETAYAAGRTMSPVLLMLMLVALRDRRIVYVLPVLLILPRLALQYQAQLTAAFRGWIPSV